MDLSSTIITNGLHLLLNLTCTIFFCPMSAVLIQRKGQPKSDERHMPLKCRNSQPSANKYDIRQKSTSSNCCIKSKRLQFGEVGTPQILSVGTMGRMDDMLKAICGGGEKRNEQEALNVLL